MGGFRAIRGTFLAGVASLSAVTGAVPALAQAAPALAKAAPSEDPEAVSEIVVTAQRREESLQHVPLSITAISGQDIREKDISDISRLPQLVPGLRLGRSGAAERPTQA